MSRQHIHSAGGDKEVLPEARGQGEIGRGEDERGNGRDREGRRGKEMQSKLGGEKHEEEENVVQGRSQRSAYLKKEIIKPHSHSRTN